MDFTNAKELSEVWTSSDKTDFKLDYADDVERKLVFSHGVVTFYVVCPTPPESTENRWHVWSDDEEVLQHLSEVQDFLDNCHRSLTEVLNKVNTCLLPLIGHAAAEYEQESVDDDFDEAYFEDIDGHDTPAKEFKHHSSSEDDQDEVEASYIQGNASPIAVHRLLKDLKNMDSAKGKFGLLGSPRENNLFIWDVQLIDIPEDTPLGKDLQRYASKLNEKPVINLQMTFPDDYPMAPPFVRILKPKFKFLTGHVTIGGSICMELLTRKGWSSANDIESILVQIRAEILSDPNVRLDHHDNTPYDETEAQEAFNRMVKKYKWDSS